MVVLVLLAPWLGPEGLVIFRRRVVLFWFYNIPEYRAQDFWSASYRADLASWRLRCLTVWVFMACFRFLGVKQKINQFLTVLGALLVILIFFFNSAKTVEFYVLFEISLVPIMMIILGWGYQSERERASLSLLFYTLTASIPLLVIVLLVLGTAQVNTFSQAIRAEKARDSLFFHSVITIIIRMAFLVKFPMYLFHLWLPKAHVEAPVVGSIILAAILLKIGGLGVVRLVTCQKRLRFSSILMLRVVVVGVGLIRILCAQLVDVKIIIAYSSVAHIGLVIYALLWGRTVGEERGLLLILAHGLSSSYMFFIANLFYLAFFSRSIVLIKGALQFGPLLAFFWFFCMISSMAGPPRVNLLAEVKCYTTILRSRGVSAIYVFLSAFFAAVYSLLIYARVSQPKKNITSTKTSSEITISLLVRLIHFFWVFLIILGGPVF